MPLIIKKPTFMNGGQVYSCAVIPPPSLGDEYCGGYYIGTTTSLDGSSYYLIVAPNATGCAFCQWKTTRTATAGTCSLTDGYANTYTGLNNADHPAGNWTATRTIGGFSDWYLPSRDELNLLYTNDGGATNTTLPAGEGFSTSYHWASTGRNATSAYSQSFFFGTITGSSQTQPYKVRAVRREPI